ncbi:MAG: hypothetical protein PVG66_07030 [Chromatiales bacterium]|jgi:hypothetical protein
MYKEMIMVAVVAAVLLLPACSPTPDVRLVLCKDLVQQMHESPDSIEWLDEQMKFSGYEDMQVQLQYKADARTESAVCFYAYEANEENAMTLSNPASAYSTYPAKMLWNDQAVQRQTLIDQINAVLHKQGKQLIQSVKTGVKKAEDFLEQNN